jgi:Protein of unknown function (DUF3604)
MLIQPNQTRHEFAVREDCSIEINLLCNRDLKVGDTVECQFPLSWSLVNGPSFTREFQVDDPDGEHYVTVEAEGATFEMKMAPRHLPYIASHARHGRHFIGTLASGAVKSGVPVSIRYTNTYAPYISGQESVWLRVNNLAPQAVVELVTSGGEAKDFRVIAPSVVRPGEDFDMLIVTLDEYQNCSTSEFDGVELFTEEGDAVFQDAQFTGSIRIPATAPESGVLRYRAIVPGLGTRLSNAVAVRKDGPKLFWGDTHIHSDLSLDAQGNNPYGYARDVSGLDFGAVADHWFSLGDMGGMETFARAEESHEPGKFVTLFADERNPGIYQGHHNLYFRDAETFEKWRDDPEKQDNPNAPTLDLSVAKKDPPEVMLIPHHTGMCFGNYEAGRITNAIDLDAADDFGFRPVMEIYSHHGQSEAYQPGHILAYEFNRMRRPELRSNASTPGPNYAQDYWMSGRRIGVIGSSDDHAAQAGIRHGGIAAVRAEELTRENIFDAIWQRQCYATTGERILLDFDVDGIPMGCEETRPKDHACKISLKVWGTAKLLRVDILRYRFGVDDKFQLLLSHLPHPEGLDATFEIDETISGPAVYYARIMQEPLDWPDMAWTSPVWVGM